MKYWPSSHGLNKLVIKAKMHANTYIVFENFLCCVKIGCYNIYIYILERLGRVLKPKKTIFGKYYFFFMLLLTKTGYFNTELVSLRYKNTTQY